MRLTEASRWRRAARPVVLLLALLCSTSICAYEVSTHAYVTHEALRRSTLIASTPGSLQERLGFTRQDADNMFRSPLEPFPLGYYDNLPFSGIPPAQFTRPALSNYEQGLIRQLLLRDRLPGFGAADLVRYQTRLEGWLVKGAIREDDLDDAFKGDYDSDPHDPIMRPFSHFYDPVGNRSLQDTPFQIACIGFTSPCGPSLNWSLGETNPLADNPSEDLNRDNHFSWQDARNSLWLALTANRDAFTGGVSPAVEERRENSQERIYRFATAIRSLGDVLHLLQDMAQPQHSRVDAHPPVEEFSVDRQIYENFTDQRITVNANPAHREESPLRLLDGGFPPAAQTPAPIIGNYPTVSFAAPRRFFTTRMQDGSDAVLARRGIADYSNRGFLTAGSLPNNTGFSQYTLPPPDFTDSGYSFVDVEAPLFIMGGQSFERLLLRSVPDSVAPSYADASLINGKAPLASQSLWFRILPLATGGTTAFGGARYRLDVRTYVSQADMLLPRAVAYSAGLIDHFFRGKILIEPPTDGLFSVVDQGMRHTVNEGYPICFEDVVAEFPAEDPQPCVTNGILGFKRLRLKLRNDTAPIIESGTAGPSIPQDLASTSATPGTGNPQLVAVARYHRNNCYQQNLQTERTITWDGVETFPNCAAGRRSTYQEISVSRPKALTAAELNGATSVAVAFDFSDDPIPINATDLIIQVVYRGPLGMERDGIAFGTYDIKEPTHLTLWNNTDYAGCNGAWVTSNAAGCNYGAGGAVGSTIDTARLCIGTQSVYRFLQTDPGNDPIVRSQYARLVALLDEVPKTTRSRILGGVVTEVQIRDRSITGQTRQSAKEAVTAQAPYLPDSMYIKRGVVGSFRPQAYYLRIGTDPQPANDMGANDVGALTLPFSPPAAATSGGVIRFPEVPAPSPTCTGAAVAFYPDEIEAAANNP